jgi:Catalytic LigB subunit of aromatic ring-opening dioxygenase
MAELVMAYSASHAPMMAADKESAPPDKRERFFGALETVRNKARESGAQAAVMVSGEHFTNFFLTCLPQIAIGLGEGHQGPLEKWLKIPKTIVPGHPGLATHIMEQTVAAGFQPALSYKMKADHGFMTVYYELDPDMQLPMVPIVMNCTTPPLMTLKQSYEFGVALGDAIRSYDGLERVILIGGGGLSHFVGEPRVGDIDEEFDRWFLKQLESQDLSNLFDMPNDELAEAGNGTGEVRAWVTVAGAARDYKATALDYEAIYEWINGMGVILYEPKK